MEALQIMPAMAQRSNSNLGEFAEDATVVVEETAKPSITFLEANTDSITLYLQPVITQYLVSNKSEIWP